METFNFLISNIGINVDIYAASIEQAEDILDSYIEEHELNWSYTYG